MLFICVEERIWWIIALLEGEYVAIIITMLVMGILLGFVGAGGAGFIIAILTLVFHIPIHVALATSLTAMAFTTLSGVISHYREGNVVLTIGGIVGGCGALGSYIGSKIGSLIPGHLLHWFTAGMLFLSAIFMFIKLIKFQNREELLLAEIKDFSKREHNEMYMSWISHWNDGWFIWDWFCTIYSTWINGSIRIDDSAICRNNNACYIAHCDWGWVRGIVQKGI